MYAVREQHATMLFKNKVVIVTGATSGIGTSTCLKFAKEGASVVLVGRKEDKLTELKKKCDAEGSLSSAFIIKADISYPDDAERVIMDTIDRFNRIDVLVNNANILRQGSMIDKSILTTFDEVMNTNLRAVTLLTSFATPHLIETKGNIVNVTSIGGHRVLAPFFSAYCMSHAAVNHFTKLTAFDLDKEGVRVNSVSTGVGVRGGEDHETLLPNWADPSEIADLILFVASDAARSAVGSNFVCDSGGLATQKTILHDY